MVVVEGTKIRRHTIGLIPKRRIFSCMISEGTVIQKSWHHSYVKAIAPHFFVLSKYVDVYEYGCGRIQIRAKGVALPHTIFDLDQRVTHAAITENKRLGAVLAHIKDEQEKRPPKVNVKPVSAKNGYVKNGRRNDGWTSKLARRAKTRAASQGSDI